MAIEVTDDLVRRIASLSRLALSPQELEAIKEHFERVLGFIADLESLETGDVDPSHFPGDLVNVDRPDEVRASMTAAAALANAPQATPDHFVVPRVVGDFEGKSS
jgi:aspartyl-tRNA(Asn)/glutamyl-tRNA(Gln) amidotransferase subunit C